MNDAFLLVWQRIADRMADLPRLIDAGLNAGPLTSAVVDRLTGMPARLIELNLATGVLLVAALLANRALERRVHASARMALFAAVFARVLLPAHWPSPFGLLEAGGAGVSLGLVRIGLPTLESPGAAPPSALAALVLAGIYGAGVAILLVRWWAARRALDTRLFGAQELSTQLRAAIAPSLPQGVALLVHAGQGPLVAGILRPRIVLPQALVDGTAERLDFVLGHELAHVRRRDQLLAAAIQIATALCWPILPLWLAARRMRTLMEMACDEEVLAGRGGVARRRYGQLLIELSAPICGGATARTVTPAFTHDLRARLRALPRRRRWHHVAQHLSTAALVAFCVTCSGMPPDDDDDDATDPALASLPAAAPHPARAPAEPAEEDFDPQVIAREIRAHMHEVKACFERVLATSKSEPGTRRLDLTFTVQEDGTLSGIKVEDGSTPSTLLGDCIAARAAGWVMPRPRGGPVEATFPLIFMANDELKPRGAKAR